MSSESTPTLYSSTKPTIRITTPITQIPEAIMEIGFLTDNNEFRSAGQKFKEDYLNGFLRNDLICFLEFPYIDKAYRDTFYRYHSTKTMHYEKDCIRISFFNSKIKLENFDDKTLHLACNKNTFFLGCLVIRPTKIVQYGRTFFSPKISSEKKLNILLKEYSFLINGSELKVDCFPSSGQDEEFHSCAETCIMNTLNYFSKYQEYSSKLPSEIISIVDQFRSDRAIPSTGLVSHEISFVLKKCGFGTKVYTGKNGDENELDIVLNDYIESGIPVIVLLSDGKNLNHAAVAIGYEDIGNNISEIRSKPIRIGDKDILDSSQMHEKKYIFIDDNHPPYQSATFNNPCSYYQDNKYKDVQVTGIVVPLDKKVYLDSLRVRFLIEKLIEKKDKFLSQKIYQKHDNPIVIRYLLTTNNSFKKTFCNNMDISQKARKVLESLNFPRFLWLVEIASIDYYNKGLINGFLIIDSTGSSTYDSIIAMVWENVIKITSKRPFKNIGIEDTTFPKHTNI